MYNILVGQSGGPTAVINSSLYGVIREALDTPEKIDTVYGMVNGIEGFLKGRVIDLKVQAGKQDLSMLRTTPASYLGSCRYKLPGDLADPVYPEIFRKLEELEIKAFFYNGSKANYTSSSLSYDINKS